MCRINLKFQPHVGTPDLLAPEKKLYKDAVYYLEKAVLVLNPRSLAALVISTKVFKFRKSSLLSPKISKNFVPLFLKESVNSMFTLTEIRFFQFLFA